MSLLGHGGVTGAELGDKEGELRDMSDRPEEILIEGLGGGDDSVGVVESQLCSIQSSDGTIESGTVLWEISSAITPCLELRDELLTCVEDRRPYLFSSHSIMSTHDIDESEPSSWSAAIVSEMSSPMIFSSSVLSAARAARKSFRFSVASSCISRVAGLSDAVC